MLTQANANESTVNNTPIQGTKLSKRIKPKVNLKNNSSTRSSNNNRSALKPPDTGQNEQDTNESNVKTPEASATQEKQDLKSSNTPEQKKIEENISIEKKTSSISENGPAKKFDGSVKRNKIENEVKDDTLSSGRKLSKRLKVGPKLSSSRPASTKKDISTTELSPSPLEVSCEQKEKSTGDEKVSNSITTESENKLQKRKKVMPNLKIPSKSETDKLLETNDNCSTKGENTTITLNETKETDNKVENSQIKISASINSDQARKTKHVHFQSSDNIAESNYVDVSNKLSSKQPAAISPEKTEKQPEKTSESSPNSKPSPSILKKDHVYDNNYSSQSEGEATAIHTSLGKGKKVFKPNLGPRRRKRLSSFSAYSSCDDEDVANVKSKLAAKPTADEV